LSADDYEIIRLMLAHGAPVNTAERSELEPCTCECDLPLTALIKRNPKPSAIAFNAAEMLVQHGADVNSLYPINLGPKTQQPIDAASATKNPAWVAFLLKHGAQLPKTLDGTMQQGLALYTTEKQRIAALYRLLTEHPQELAQLVLSYLFFV
jgi:hypothetical protein